MKKRRMLSSLLALTMCLSMFAFTASAETSDNLLVNPSFEDGMNGWVAPDGKWSTVEDESGYEPRDGSYFAWP
ncbi:MAG: hypothetical protein E7600_06575, partial [Ruminococcaceae bacterium]|nr:hypothetical protein [Oscillospiraceae bacterium]